MPIQLAQNAVCEIQVVGQLHGQVTRTTFHGYNKGQARTPSLINLVDWISGWWDDIGATFRGVLSSEWQLLRTSLQVISPTRYRRADSVPTVLVPGLVDGDSCPSGTAVVVRRQAELAGRTYSGRIYLPAVPLSWVEDSILSADRTDEYYAVMEACNSAMSADPLLLTPCITRTTGADMEDQEIANIYVDRIIRYQRRREVRVGE